MRVLLVGNYPADKQKSMERFCNLLGRGLEALGHEVRVVRPKVICNWKGAPKFLAKWLGYLDKYLFFPFVLVHQDADIDVAHICDHSNAMYAKNLRNTNTIVTCHDLLAVRSALGEKTYCPVSPAGFFLQKWILSSLKTVPVVVCDSLATMSDVHRLVGINSHQVVRKVPAGLDPAFTILSESEAVARLRVIVDLNLEVPYLLAVGSGETRKNRVTVLKAFSSIREKFHGQLIFAGDPLSDELKRLAVTLEIADRVLEVSDQPDSVLAALYNQAFALVFPSLSEGFGWPIIEAQACGCPVVASNVQPCPEVAGSGALFVDPLDFQGVASACLSLMDPMKRSDLIEQGKMNAGLYSIRRMVEEYLPCYGLIAN